jgi:hypothetical protein
MGLRIRFVLAAATLAGLVALFIGGLLFSPQKQQARAAEAPLLPIASGVQLTGVDIVRPGAAQVSLRPRDSRWEAEVDGRSFPASSERIQALAMLLAGLQRGSLMTRDPVRSAELGLGLEQARLLVLHLAGRPNIALEVGERAPSGEEDYVRVRGESAVYLVRSSLSVLLAQDLAYWFDLRVLPGEVRGETIARITVRGGVDLGSPAGVLRGDYALERGSGERGGEWSLSGASERVDAAAAASMADSLALLEGEDFLEAAPVAPPARPAPDRGTLEVEVATLEGKAYSLRVRAGPKRGLALVTAGGSPWTYLVREAQLRRAVRPPGELLADR